MGFPIELGAQKWEFFMGRGPKNAGGPTSSGGPDFGEWRTLRSGSSCAMDHPWEDEGSRMPQKTVDALPFRGEGWWFSFGSRSRIWGLGASSWHLCGEMIQEASSLVGDIDIHIFSLRQWTLEARFSGELEIDIFQHLPENPWCQVPFFGMGPSTLKPAWMCWRVSCFPHINWRIFFTFSKHLEQIEY